MNRIFTMMTIMMAFWIFSGAVSDASIDISTAEIFARMAIFGPFVFMPLIFVFAHDFPYETGPLVRWKIYLAFAPVFLTLPLIFTKYNIVSVSKAYWGTDFVPGELYTVFGIYILLITFLVIKELVRKLRSMKKKQDLMQTAFLFTGFFLMILLGLVFNLVLPIFGYAKAATLGPAIATGVMVLLTTYAIVKHHLLDVKVIAAEFFGSALSLFMFLQLFSAESVGDFMIRGGFFVLTTAFAVLLVRSVIQEVKQRQEVQRLARQLQSSNKRLRRLDNMKTTMVSIASHQLRGPLGGMRGYFTMFRDGDLGPLTDKQKEIVKMNLNTLSRLLNAVETFLDITKLEAGKMVLRKEVLPLDEAVKDVAHEFEIMLKRKGLELKTEIEEHVWVEFDPEKIKHVIFNLVDNAMKYTESGWIKVSLNKEGAQAIVRVSDSGKGIPAEDLPRLFGKFQRGELAVDRGGSGLGLYVVKMLTEMQGGTVSVSSPGVGKGTTFTVELPLSKDHH